VIVEFVVEVDIGAARRIEAGQQLAHDNEQFHVCGFFDEPALRLVLIGLRSLTGSQHVVDVGVELVALIAVCGLS
jgi:hypothetical protein